MTKPNQKDTGSKKPRSSTQRRNNRLQQIVLAVIGIVVIISMVLALAMNY